MSVSASVVFCDDIRFEASGKYLLVGVYPENLVPGELPQHLPLSIWVRLRGVPAGSHDVHFAVGANGTAQVEADLRVTVPEGKAATHLTLVGLPLQLQEFGAVFLTITGLPGGETVHEELPVVPPSKPPTVEGAA